MSTEDLRKALKKEHKLWEDKEILEDGLVATDILDIKEQQELNCYRSMLKKIDKKIIRLLKKELNERRHADTSNLNVTDGFIVRDGSLYLRYVAPAEIGKSSGLSWVVELRDATFFPGVCPPAVGELLEDTNAEILNVRQECRWEVQGKTTP